MNLNDDDATMNLKHSTLINFGRSFFKNCPKVCWQVSSKFGAR